MTIAQFNVIQSEYFPSISLKNEKRLNRLYSRMIINSLTEQQVRSEMLKISKLK